jgi:hypothetical protein
MKELILVIAGAAIAVFYGLETALAYQVKGLAFSVVGKSIVCLGGLYICLSGAVAGIPRRFCRKSG